MQPYEIIDEPADSKVAQLAVNPFWILLGTMLGGIWLGWPWFVVNSLAVGSMHRRREILLVVVGFVVCGLLSALGVWAMGTGYLNAVSAPYAGLLLVVWKLGVSYVLQFWQTPGYQLAVHFRGHSRNGAVLVFVGLMLRSYALSDLPGFWFLVLS